MQSDWTKLLPITLKLEIRFVTLVSHVSTAQGVTLVTRGRPVASCYAPVLPISVRTQVKKYFSTARSYQGHF